MRNLTQLLLLLFVFHVTMMPALGNSGEALSVVSGVIPHHLLAKEIMVDFSVLLLEESSFPIPSILLSPDHLNSAALERGNSFISVNWESNDIRLGDIAVDGELLTKIATKIRIRPNPGAVLLEFGIMNLLAFNQRASSRSKNRAYSDTSQHFPERGGSAGKYN